MFDYLDKTVSKKLETAIDKHLSVCPHCSARYAEERRFHLFIKEGTEYITAPLSIDDMFVERLTACAKERKEPVMPFLDRTRKFVLTPVGLILLLCIIPAVIWLISSQTPGPEERRTSRTPKAVTDLLVTDSLTDWHERRLVITVQDQRGKITRQIVTSYNNEEIVLNSQNNGTQNNGG
jgi:hypothetical protein